MNFKTIAYDKIPMSLNYHPTGDLFKEGDYVELLAHDDDWAIVSPCPLGDQNDTSTLEDFANWPWRITIYEGKDGPLETALDRHRKTTEPFSFILAGPVWGLERLVYA